MCLTKCRRLLRELALTSLGRKVAVNFTLVVYYAPAPADLPPLPPDLQPLLAQQGDGRDEGSGSAPQKEGQP